MKLLYEIESAGAPCDYLFARIRCRRATLDVDGRGSWSGPADPRQALKAEYAWVYAQLDRRLRAMLLPFFEYIALRSLVIALRYLASGERAAMDAQLEFSLLHPQVQKVLLGSERATPVVIALEGLLGRDYPYVAGLTDIYLRQGPGGLEQALLGGCLQQALPQIRCPQLRELLCYLLDMRNLLALYKHLHWQVPSPPPLLSGGAVPLTRCEKIWAQRDLRGLLAVMRNRAQQRGDPEVLGVEEFLLRGLTAQLHQAGRDPLQPGLVLDYLWRCLLAARNRGLRQSGRSAQEDESMTEVVS